MKSAASGHVSILLYAIEHSQIKVQTHTQKKAKLKVQFFCEGYMPASCL